MAKMEYPKRDETITEPQFAVLPIHDNPGVTAVVLPDDRIGDPGEHGKDLLLLFLQGLCNRQMMPDLVLLYGRGIFLLESGHPAAEYIERLISLDVVVRAAVESLQEYGIEPVNPKVQPAPMRELTQDILRADRVIRP